MMDSKPILDGVSYVNITVIRSFHYKEARLSSNKQVFK